ncbi:hypothetical protein M9458_051332, partial [Cirrhinus mrigala]
SGLRLHLTHHLRPPQPHPTPPHPTPPHHDHALPVEDAPGRRCVAGFSLRGRMLG